MSAVSVRLEGFVAWNRPRMGRHGVYMPPKYVAWKQAAVAAVAAARMERHTGPVRLQLTVVVQRPLRPALREGAPREWHVGHPDVDNVAKGVMDVLQEAGVLVNDKQVVDARLRRVWGEVEAHASSYARDARERSCCEVTVTPLEVSDVV